MILPLLLLTFLNLEPIFSTTTSNHTLIFGYTTGDENGKYRNSLNNLLNTLSSQTSTTDFSNITTSFPQTPNQLHGLYLCRGDANPQLCHSCINYAIYSTLNNMDYGREGYFWYDHCMIKYSNESFSGKWDLNQGSSSWSWNCSKIKGSRILFMRILRRTMKELAIQASNVREGNKFASKVLEFSKMESLNVMVQCTPDLMASDCYRCLMHASKKLVGLRGSETGQVLYSGCMAEYKTTTFALLSANKVESLPLLPSTEVTNSTSIS